MPFNRKFPKNIVQLSQCKIRQDSQPAPVYAQSRPQDATKIGFLNLPRELRDQIYEHAREDGKECAPLLRILSRSALGRNEFVDPRGGLEMPQLPLRLVCAAKKFEVDVKESIDMTTDIRCETSIAKAANRVLEALWNASMAKEVLLHLVTRGSPGEVVRAGSKRRHHAGAIGNAVVVFPS
ncbi:hypothetical protein FKW77_005939 [Venturia effusa]|uniref:Uncharacterized protein n=1 Tax=Venturia effusa TaxID=50376 RepID=A0A517LH98_9PEZI|nr:hypothetical protein FKW77_005939 [Venturia effusa]